MTRREVDVSVSMSVVVDAETPIDARSKVARRVSQTINGIEGKTDGSAIGTRGGVEVSDD